VRTVGARFQLEGCCGVRKALREKKVHDELVLVLLSQRASQR